MYLSPWSHAKRERARDGVVTRFEQHKNNTRDGAVTERRRERKGSKLTPPELTPSSAVTLLPSSPEDASVSVLQSPCLHACIPRQLACMLCIPSARTLMPNEPALAVMRERVAAAASPCLMRERVAGSELQGASCSGRFPLCAPSYQALS